MVADLSTAAQELADVAVRSKPVATVDLTDRESGSAADIGIAEVDVRIYGES
jgi:hypothetical protein